MSINLVHVPIRKTSGASALSGQQGQLPQQSQQQQPQAPPPPPPPQPPPSQQQPADTVQTTSGGPNQTPGDPTSAAPPGLPASNHTGLTTNNNHQVN
ncbi:unnamed protein product [Protopolystoma xenopodis]|uniref:Uncharacterized protein n=1 Tax=Protopolystoma xenopodis TaxID=117903 RepID=A0A3S5BXR6_9PLAT|nr:unnamed protein product [Protopolystoma xenopodis]